MRFSINKIIHFPVAMLLKQLLRSLLVRDTDAAREQDCLRSDEFGSHVRGCYLTVFLILLFAVKACDTNVNAGSITTMSGPTMGTEYQVKIADSDAFSNSKQIKENIDRILVDINQAMSTYIVDSELSLINRNTASEWIAVSDDLWTVLIEADRISSLSNGAFDITVGPLVNLWGFGPQKFSEELLPDENKIAQTLNSVGYKNIEYNPAEKKIRKLKKSLYIDLSAIAKGYAVDKIATYLDSRHFGNYMIEIGGEIRTRGRRSTERMWRVGIEKPLTDRRAVQKIIEPGDMGMATSGDYRNFMEINGKRYSHTIDPNTGKPVTHDLASVTVLHESAMTADALATALNVLGPDAGIQLANKKGISACFIVRSGNNNKYREFYTHNFDSFFVQKTIQ